MRLLKFARRFFWNSGQSTKFLTKTDLINVEGEVLTGDSEKAYWAKIMKDRQAKLSGQVASKNKKPRGKVRIVKKIRDMQHKENVHKYFEEDDESADIE